MKKRINEFHDFKEGNSLNEDWEWWNDLKSAASSAADWAVSKASDIYDYFAGSDSPSGESPSPSAGSTSPSSSTPTTSSTSTSDTTTSGNGTDPGDEPEEQTTTQKIFGILASRGTLPKEFQAFYYRTAEKQKKEGIGWSDTGIGLKNSDLDKALDGLSPSELEATTKSSELAAGASEILAPDYSEMGSFDYSMSSAFRSYGYNDYVSLAEGAGHKVDSEKWTLLGIRNKISIRKDHMNGFVDALVLISPKKEGRAYEYQATTFPGMVFRVRPYRAYFIQRGTSWLAIPPSNQGVAILQPGVYKYKVGKYKGKDCLLQDGEVTVERYPLVSDPKEATKISTYSPGGRQSGDFGILVHRAGSNTSKIDNHSAGCQVTKKSADMDEIVKKVSGSENSGKITYVLVEL